MGRRILSFLLKDLQTIRVRCHRCENTVEASIANIRKGFIDQACPICKQPICATLPDANPLSQLADAISVLNRLDKLDVEFVIEDKAD